MKVIQHFLNNGLRNFNYVVYSEVNNNATFFDPLDIKQTLPLTQDAGAIPKYLLTTHNHPDHIKDVGNYLDLTGTEYIRLKDGEEFQLSETEKIKCVDTPGHVEEHQCFILSENDKEFAVICGDTIFNAGVGNCKNGGDPDTLAKTIDMIVAEWDDNLTIYPSHDYFMTNLKFSQSIEPENNEVEKYMTKYENGYFNTTIGEEKKINPFFRAFSHEFVRKYGKTSHEIFKDLRAKRDKW